MKIIIAAFVFNSLTLKPYAKIFVNGNNWFIEDEDLFNYTGFSNSSNGDSCFCNIECISDYCN
jgi:hypothetical protein